MWTALAVLAVAGGWLGWRAAKRHNRLLECTCDTWEQLNVNDGRYCNFCGRRIVHRPITSPRSPGPRSSSYR